MRGESQIALSIIWTAATLLIFGSAPAIAHSVQDDIANARLAYKLAQLSKSLDMKEAHYDESGGGGGKNFNSNDGNTFMSNTTYHSYVWNYCSQWVGLTRCRKWIPPYISRHGLNPDRSKLEGVVWNNYQQVADQGPQQDGNNVQFAIWNIKTRGGSILDRDGKLNDQNITDWRLKPQVLRQVEAVGAETADRNINATLDRPDANPKTTMTSMETLRFMAERWTRMMYNRALSGVGEARTMRKPIEFALGENRPNCNSYLDAIRRQQQQLPGGPRLKAQALLELESRTKQLEQRYALCEKMRQQSGSMVNPQVQGDDIVAGSPDSERGAEWRYRVQLATITRAGINPNAVPHPGDAQISRFQYANNMKKYDAGGTSYQVVSMTNADQLNGYNSVLASAAEGVKAAAARNPYMVDYSGSLAQYQIQPATRSAIEINSMTPDMRNELASTGFPRTTTAEFNRGPAVKVETTPGQLSVRKLQ